MENHGSGNSNRQRLSAFPDNSAPNAVVRWRVSYSDGTRWLSLPDHWMTLSPSNPRRASTGTRAQIGRVTVIRYRDSPRGLSTCSQRPLRVARASSGHRGCRLNAPAQIFRWDCSSGSNAKADRPLRRQALNERSGRSVDDRLRWPAWPHRVGIVEVKTYQSLLRSPSVKTSFIGNGSSQRCGGWREAFLMLSPVAQWRLAARITARAPWNRNAAGLLGCRLSGHSGPGRSPGWPS